MTIEFSHSSIQELGAYRVLRQVAARLDATTAATRVMWTGNMASASNAAAGLSVFYLDPADIAVSGRTSYMRLRGTFLTNDVAPTVDFYVALFPVTAVAGAATTVSVTLGSVTAQTSTVTAPNADTRNQAVSSDFAAPTAGYYALAAVNSGTMAASSSVAISAELSARWV